VEAVTSSAGTSGRMGSAAVAVRPGPTRRATVSKGEAGIMQVEWHEDDRPKPDGHYATINRKRFPTVTVSKVQRFRSNRVVRDLLDAARQGRKLDLNEIAIRAGHGAYSKDEMHELYRLIGYSVCGFSEAFEDDSIGSDLW
jgi:hypothetical protein